jgi:hypothetical protein
MLSRRGYHNIQDCPCIYIIAVHVSTCNSLTHPIPIPELCNYHDDVRVWHILKNLESQEGTYLACKPVVHPHRHELQPAIGHSYRKIRHM